ncbi:MAG: RNA polymerase sigma factor [Actinomycetota bacterium]
MPDEFTAFCEAEHPRLVGALTLWCGSREVAEEVVQDAFARAYRDWSRVRGLDRPGAWVRRVAFNLATSRFRRWQAERRANRRHSGRPGQVVEPVDTVWAVTVREALGQLSAPQRTVLVLRYYLDLPVCEVAAITGRSESAVTSLTARALEALRDHVEVIEPVRGQEPGHE